MTTKLFKLSMNLIYLTTIVLSTLLYFTITANAEEGKEKIRVEQVGTSGGIPAIKAQLDNAGGTGTYMLVITNPTNSTTYSQELNKSGKPTTFAITNFSENGTYAYTLQLNGMSLFEGGVNLVSTKRVPTFNAQIVGTDLTIDISKAVDQSGKTIHFKSGSYSNSLVINSDSMQRAFEGVTGVSDTITFSDEKGDLATVPLKKIGGGGNSGDKPTPPTEQPKPGNNGNGVTSLPTTTVKPPVSDNSGSGPVANVNDKVTVSLNKKSYKLEETIVATVKVTNGAYASRSLTVRLGADDNSATALVDLNNKGEGSATFKILVPQPSSKVISASIYTISGSLIGSASAQYGVEGEVEGGSGLTTESDVDKDSPFAEYVSLDLTTLEKGKATLAWYKARNISKYPTKLKVINGTTKEERIYSVFMPDGDSKIDLNLIFGGPGIYTWELHSGGKLVAQAPFSTPLAIDGTAVSQDGLPVLKTLANKDLYLSHLDGTDLNGVGADDLGEEIGGVVADDFTEEFYQEEQVYNQEGSNKSKVLVILIIVLVLSIAGVAIFIVIKRHKEEQEETPNTFKSYEDEEYNEEELQEIDDSIDTTTVNKNSTEVDKEDLKEVD